MSGEPGARSQRRHFLLDRGSQFEVQIRLIALSTRIER
jgi:hypothetical protein